MTDWTMMCWQGPPAAAADGLRQFGWSGPGEGPSDAIDARIGGFIPPIGQPIVTIEGTAFVALVATGPIEPPSGLAPTDPDLSRSIIGSF
ncbi:hypothetical protein [Falsiroseomonas ponticola]|jgi:hypothetical protein|uniref:hypothetical protein n=1 Tax=Falsiroseomonas ponticola TaxID=2786951 RepID=UPI001934732E|nr:hypothetical protein [Roseomonas ponticola]